MTYGKWRHVVAAATFRKEWDEKACCFSISLDMSFSLPYDKSYSILKSISRLFPCSVLSPISSLKIIPSKMVT